jgi:hypothetical protein
METKDIIRQVQLLRANRFSIREISKELNITKYKVECILKDTIPPVQSFVILPNQTSSSETQDGIEISVSDASGSASETDQTASQNTITPPIPTENRKNNQFLTAQKQFLESLKRGKMYSLHEFKGFYTNINLYCKEYKEFITLMIQLHGGKGIIFQSNYTDHLKKAEWLVLVGHDLVGQLEEDFESLIVSEALESISITIKKIINLEDPVKSTLGLLHLTDRCRTQPCWQQCIDQDIFYPKTK